MGEIVRHSICMDCFLQAVIEAFSFSLLPALRVGPGRKSASSGCVYIGVVDTGMYRSNVRI